MPGPVLSSGDTPMDKTGTIPALTQVPVCRADRGLDKDRHQSDSISLAEPLPHSILPRNIFSKVCRIKEMAVSSIIKRLLTSIPGSHVAAQSWEAKKSGASYIIASNPILDSCWFPESNKCQAFYEGRKQIRGQGLGSRPRGSSISEPDKVKPKGHALGFLESQLEKMPILKPLSLKRLAEETQGCPREYCNSQMFLLLLWHCHSQPGPHFWGRQEDTEENCSLLEEVETQRHHPLVIQTPKNIINNAFLQTRLMSI